MACQTMKLQQLRKHMISINSPTRIANRMNSEVKSAAAVFIFVENGHYPIYTSHVDNWRGMPHASSETSNATFCCRFTVSEYVAVLACFVFRIRQPKRPGCYLYTGCIPSQAPTKIYNAELWLEAKTFRTTAMNIDVYDDKKGGTRNLTVSSFSIRQQRSCKRGSTVLMMRMRKCPTVGRWTG